MGEVTIVDVAEKANVSPATVSRVLNKSAPVSSTKKERVKRAIEKLNYKPNKFAHALRKQRSDIVGIVVPDLSNPYFANLIRGAEIYLHQIEKSALICDTNSKPEQEGEYVNKLLEERVDGVILVSSGEDSEQLELLLEKDIPVVAADRDPHLNKVSKVLADNSEGGTQVASHLIQQGYETYSFVKGPPGISTAESRYHGFLEELHSNGKRLKESFIFEGDYTYESGREIGRKLIEDVEDKFIPLGIAASDDLMALGILWELQNTGAKVPEEFGLTGFDDILMAKLMYPSLSTVKIPAYQIGKEAAKILLENIERSSQGMNMITTKKIFDVELVPRKSTNLKS